jgi:2'-5' RNA ligase
MRLFVALEIPDETRAKLAGLIARLRPKCPAVKWVRPEAMHVTLKFIGHVREEKLGAIRAALANVGSPQPIDLQFRGLGFFPNEKRPRVFWCRVEASENAAPLAAAIDGALMALAIGIKAESRPFTPHLTLARIPSDEDQQRDKAPAALDRLTTAAREFAHTELGSLCTGEFHLFESKTKPTGAEYTRLDTFRFVQAAT